MGDNVELDLGYRFLDLGNTSVPLIAGLAGNYEAYLVSHQIMFCVRLYVP